MWIETQRSRWLSLLVLGSYLATLDDATAAPGGGGSDNAPPTISGEPPLTAVTGQTYSFRPEATDPDGHRLWFWISNQPGWASFDTKTGELRGTPTQAGRYLDIVVGVRDPHVSASLPAFTIEVVAPLASAPAPEPTPANQPPTIEGSPATSVSAGQAYAFQPTATDPEGARLSFSIRNRPAWASFDASTGGIAGTPASDQVGTYPGIEISVTDGEVFADLAPFGIEVTAAPNRAPTITGVPSTNALEGQLYVFAPSASDADGDSLQFSIQNRPSWATFSTTTGQLAGTPASDDVGDYADVVIAVSDGEASSSLAPFAIAVAAAPNHPPTLTGSAPTTALVGEPYAFAPSASDPDGDRLVFTITGQPTWARFDTASGQLSGTPTTSDLGSYYDIVISASDGEASTSLPAFDIRVDQPATASVTLSWQAPTANEDGTPLTDLAGYQVHYGQSTGQYSETLSLPSAALTSVTIENLAPATWYFAVKAVNSAGVQSSFSDEAWKTTQ